MDDYIKLKFYFLGNIRVETGAGECLAFGSKRSKSLLAFLVLNSNKPYPKEVIFDQVWGGDCTGDPQKCLRQELWQIRTAFRKAGFEPDKYILSREDALTFQKDSTCWVDTEAFEEIFSERAWDDYDNITSDQIGELMQAIDLYTGEFMPGNYDHWCLGRREELIDKHMRLLESLMNVHEICHSLDDAISMARRILRFDILREDIHLKLMLYYLQKGNRSKAVKQYRQCEATLRKELNITPDFRLTELYSKISNQEDVPSEWSGFDYTASNIQKIKTNPEVFKSLTSIKSELDRLSKRITRMINQA